MSDKLYPRRIRDTNGRVPPLTEAQRAKIITVDLDNPPPFVRVLRDYQEMRTIIDEPNAVAEAWVYRHDWGSSAAIFNRRESRTLTERRNYSILNSLPEPAANVPEAQLQRLESALQSPLTAAFIENLRTFCLKTKESLSSSQVYAGIDFERHAMPSDVHIDVIELRAFTALEHGNVVLPNMAAARKAGFRFTSTTDAARYAWELVDLIEAGVPVYSAALGDFTFMRGHLPPAQPTWHAAYPKNPMIDCDRPTIKVDFSF